MFWKQILAEAAILIAAAAVIGAAMNIFRPEARTLAWIGDYRTAAPGVRVQGSDSSASAKGNRSAGMHPLALAPQKDPGLLFLEIGSDVAFRLQGAGALFIDARRSSVYEEGHIEKALSIPVWERDADGRVAGLQAKGVKPDQVIVVYCSGGECEDAAMLSGKLALAGFHNVYLYKDGFPDWKRKGWPVAQGKLQ
jgi:rhodanese-related sulfurtransferase